MRKTLKWILTALIGLILFAVVAAGLLFGLSQLMLIRTPEWNYYKSENNTISLMAYKGDAEVLVIPGEMEGLPVTSLNAFAFGDVPLRDVTLPPEVTYVSPLIFSSCSDLETIRVAGGNTAYISADGLLLSADGSRLEIIPNAWESCVVPEGVTVIGQHCGAFHDRLQRVVLPEGVTTLEEFCFYDCAALQEVSIPASVTSIGEFSFHDTPGLTLLVVPGTVGEAYAIEHAIPCRLAE